MKPQKLSASQVCSNSKKKKNTNLRQIWLAGSDHGIPKPSTNIQSEKNNHSIFFNISFVFLFSPSLSYSSSHDMHSTTYNISYNFMANYPQNCADKKYLRLSK